VITAIEFSSHSLLYLDEAKLKPAELLTI